MRIKHIFLLVSIFFTFGLFAQNATFQAVDSTQCPGSLFILTANNTTYPSAAYAWQITSPTGVVSNYSGNDTIGIVLTSPGLYDVKLTVTSGGTASVTKLDYLTVYAKPSIIYSVTPTTGCSPMNVVFNGSCTAGSGSIVSYSINTANGFISSAEDFSYTYTNSTSGNLIFKPKATVTNSEGCFDTLTLATITVKPSPSLSSPTNPNAVCSGSTFNYSPTSTTTGCTFSWTRPAIPNITPNTGSGTGNISETLTNTSGSNILVTYNVTTTAPNGCSTTQAVLVTVRALPTVTIDSPTLTVCNGSSDTITATASGTTGTFNWNNGLSTPSIIVSAAGTYTVTYSDGFCSSASAVSVVTLTAPPSITNSTLSQNVCTGVATTAVPWTSSLAGTTYAWTATATPAASLTGFSASGTGNLPVMTINSTSSSNATVTYTVTPTANGCAGPQISYVITIYPKPVNNYTIATNNACSSPVTTSYTSTSTNATGGVSWTFPGGSPATYTGAGPVPVTYNSSGNYSITMTSTSANGCISTTTFANTITVGSGVPPTGTIALTTPVSQCLTGNSFCFNFSGTGADTLRWDWGDGSAFQYTDPLVNPTCHTFNTVGTFVVTMIPFKTVGPVLSCSGTATQITVIVKGPVASFTASTVDCDNQLTRTFTNASTGTTASTTYAWSFGDPGSGAANNSTLASPSHTFSSYSSLPYTVTLTAADATTGCSNSTATASISCYPNTLSSFQAFNPSCVPTWNGTSFTPATCTATNEVCLGGILSFVNTTPSPQLGTTGASSNFTQWDWNPTNGYQWSTGTYFKGTPRAYTFSETAILQSTNLAWTPGIYSIAMRNRRDNVTTIGTNSSTVSCYQIVTNTIKVNGIIGTFSAPDTVCVGSSFTATDNSTAPVTSIVSRLWNWGDGTTTSGNVSNPSHTYSTPGVYTITLTVTDASVLACTKTTTRTIIVRKPTASFTINRNFICNNQTVVVANNSTGVGLSTYNWSATNASPATATGSSFGAFTFTQQGNQTITLTVTDNLGCVDDTTIAISVFDVLAAANPPTATFSCFNSSPPNQVTFTNLSTNNVDITSAQWNFGNGQTSTAWSPSTNYTLPGTYNVFLTVTSLTGCTSTQQVSTITVGGPSATLDITNANLAGCSCYNATISISTSNVSSVSFFPYGSGTFSSVSPNTTQNITQSYCNTGSTSTTVTPAVYISGNSGCNGLINFTETITINPVPAITAMTSVVCSQTAFSATPVNVTNGVVPTGTTYSWSAPVAAGITGLSSGTNATSISGTLTNTTNAPINVVYTVTPTSGSCAGSTFTVTVTVNPKPAITAMTSVVCSQTAFSVIPVNVTNGVVPTGTTYSWSAPVAAGITGLSSGTNATSISGTLTNTTNAPINVVYTVTPTSGSCAGSTFTVTVTVNPKPAITAMTSVVCSQTAFSVTPVNVTNGVVPTGTTYSWSAPVAAGITGLSSGTNATSISGTLTNTTNAPINVVYTVTPTSGSCAGSTFTVTVTVNPKPAITAMTSVVCSQTAFSVTPVNVTNGVVPTGTTYSWSAPVAAGITGLSSGTNATSISGTLTNTTNAPINVVYTVTPTSGSCAGSTFTVTVTVNPKPAITAMTSVVCSQTAFSVIPVNVTNGVVPTGTTYSWSAPVAAGITGLSSGTNATSISGTLTNTTNAPINVVYTVTPTSGSCAGSTFTVTVTVNPLPTFTVTPTNPTLCNGTNGSILLTGLQNNTAYTYSLNGASAVAVTSSASGQATISSLGAGTYTLTVTLVSTGCISATQSVSLTNPGAPNVNDITDQVLCGGSYTLPVITGTNLSGNQSYYTGTNGTGTAIAAGTAISTSQTIYIYGSTPGGCSDQETFTVTINPLPTISGTITVCVGSTTQLTGSGTANASSPWTSSTPANATVSSTGLVTGVAVGSSTITYTDNNGCQKTAIVTVNPLPTFTATPTNPTLCNGTNGSILLTGLQNNTAYTYSLNGASAVAVTSSASGQATISSLGAGTYTLTVTLVSTGCTSASQSITLTNPGAPNVNDITDQVLCGGSYTLPVITGTNLSGNQSYYTGTNGTGTAIAAGTAISTSQTIYIYGSTPGGCSDQETFTVTINPLPTISGTITVCVGSTTQLTGSGTANASSPWTSSTPANATVSSTGLVTGVAVGSSTITYTDNNGCQKTAIVTVNPLPTFTATPTNPTLCNGTNGSILLTGLQNNTSYTYSLNGASAVAVTSSASGQATISSLGAGTYTLTVTLVSTGCTSASQSITLTNPGAPNVNDITDQVLCGGSYTLPVITGTNLSGNQSYYTGTNGTGTAIAAGTAISTSQTIYIYGSTPGGCSDEETFTVTIQTIPTLSAGSTLCVGNTLQLSASTSGSWVSNTPSIASVIPSTGLVTGLSIGNVTFTFTDATTGCTSITSTVSVNATPTANAGADLTICATTSFVNLTGSFGGSASSVVWTGGNGGVFSSPATINTTYTFSSADVSAGSVWLYLTTNDPVGDCSFAKDSLLITINPSAIVNAGVDQVTCGTTPVSLNGTVGGAGTSATWSTTNGTGTFSSNNSLNASYTPSLADVSTVYINIVLTSNDPLGPCPAVTDTVVISVDPPATANAGLDFVSCSNTPINLNGIFGGSASTGIWSGSSNPVVNNPTTSNVIYNPSVAEVSSGSVILTFTTNDPAGSCLAVSDQVQISFSTPAIVNAGNDTTICSGSTVGLNGTFGGLATSATWSSAGTPPGVFTGSSLYTPSAAEITAGTAVLTYTTNNPAGPCPAVSDQKIITINPTPTVAGLTPITVCSGTALNQLLTGVVSSNYTWIANDNPQTVGETTTLQTTASITDVITNQTTIDQVVIYTITPTAVGSGCVGVPQTFAVTVKPTPTLLDPADQTLCANTTTLAVPFTSNLPGTTFDWTISPANVNIGLSNGTGNSIPSFTALNTFTTSIVATVTVTPTSALSCAGTPQVFTYTILPVSTVVDPSDQVICAGATTASVNFTGSDPATVYNWTLNNTTIGAGLVSPNSGNIASFVGINNGTTDVTGTFTVTPSLNNCLGTPQTFTITVKPLPIMQTPASQTVCVGNSTAQVVFSSSILGTTYSWTNSNSTIGLPAASVGNVTFIPSFVSQNSTNIIDTATIVVIPTFNGCAGSAVSFQFIVNPILQVTPITNVVYCAGDAFPGVSFTGNVPTANYSWSTDNVSIGFPVSGQSNVPGINSFTTQNSGNLTQIANVTVTPSLPGCQGTPFTFTITVKPLPTVYIAPLTQSHCNGSSTVAVDFTGNLDPLTTYSWTQTNTSISTVLLGSGTNDIPSFTATNTGLVSETSVFYVTPSYNGCTGIQDTFSITVNPIPTVANVLDQNWCAGQPSDPVNFTGSLGSTATYNWTQTNQYIGNTLVPTVGDIPSFTTQNLSTIIQTDTITVTPSFNGCNGIPEVFVITVRPTPTVYPVANQSHCVYAYTNPVVFNGNMGTAATYAWVNNNTVINSSVSSGNDSIPSFQVQNPGNTIVVATFTVTPEANGCFGTPGTFTISSVDPIPTVIPTADIILCAGSQTGTIDFQPNDPTITYHWTNDNISIGLVGTGTNDISNFQLQNTGIANQTAHVIVTPEYNGCFGLSDTFDITVKPIPNVFITPLYDSLCANQNTAYVDFTGDIAGTNYIWTNNNTLIGLGGSGTGDIASFVATNIGNNIQTATITVTPDFNGCSGTPQTTTITVNPISTVVLPTQPIFYCHGDSITDIIFNGNNPGTIYQWTNNNTAINLPSSGVGNILSFPVTNTDVVNYEAIIAVQPVLNGCPGTLDSFKIIVKPIPTVYAPANQFLCANQASALVDFQGNMTDSTVFNWFNTNVSIGLLNPTLTGGSGNIPSFVATNVGQLTQVADVIVVPTLNGCIGIADTFQYTVYPISTVNLVNDTVCTGDFVNQLNFVGSNPTATYEWTCYNTIGLNPLTGFASIPGFTAFNSGTTPQDGIIVVTPYVSGCPGVNDTLHIVVNPRPIITPSPDQIVCANDITAPVVFGSNISGTTYTWQNSNISIGLASSGTTDIASFTSINTDATGLILQNGTIIVTPYYNGCSGLNDTLSITVNPLPVVNAGLDTTLCFGQYLLLTGSGTATTYSWDNGAINGVPYYPSATTLFTVVGTDNNLCQNTDQILVTYLLDLPPVVSAGPDTAICFSQSITLNGSGNALVYNWNNNVLDGQSFNPAQTDTYIVIGTAANGCIASDTMELIVHPLPIVSINVVDSILCAGEQALLWGSGAVTYVWDNNVIDNVPFTPNATDTYTMIGYDQFGCTDTASITVVVNPMPNVLFSSDMNFGGCLPFSPTFTDQTGANGNGPTSASVMWYFGNGTSSNQLGSVTNIYDSYGCYDVTLVSTTAEACTDSLTLQDFVCVNELVASFTPDPLSQPISNPVFEFTNTSQNATDFQWFFGDGTESDFVSTSHMYDSIGCYEVILVASAQDGCTDTAVQVVCVKDEVIIYVPNTFTPDGDRLNDIFIPILTAGYRPGTYEFAIYNRWGEQFFYTEDVDQGWDGKFKGNEVQVGTYTYTIRFKSSMDNNVYTFNGHVNLIR